MTLGLGQSKGVALQWGQAAQLMSRALEHGKANGHPRDDGDKREGAHCPRLNDLCTHLEE